MKKLSVCILFGGMSPEHEVSLRSAESVLNHIDESKYNLFPVGITKEGDWILYGGKDYSKLVTGYRDVVMLIMLDTSYDLTAQSFVDAFGKVVGEPEFVI